MTDTPETDNLARGNHVVPTEFAEKLERERDEAREDLSAEIKHHMETSAKWNGHHMDLTKVQCDLNKAIRERDRLANVLQNIRSGYGGQIPDPDCYCGDCEFLINIDTVLRFLTPNEP
jgi:hypothetical protein